ncbi:MAG: TonB-dependent receptor [Prevotellaceae bacterium]|jgi:outer membrane receptor protein involved in Fe transport|nr:TonB-dependent receptor [Prevotellaceae bacterium]
MKKYILIALLLSGTISLQAVANENDSITALQELVVIHSSTPKEISPEREQALASYQLNRLQIENRQIGSLKDISLTVPNFYIPDYGSKITSSVYVRGVGSRMNEPAIGLYIDNIPYPERSGFDFDFYDIASITLLQGPQGTLYGRNAIGGLVNIYTLSPFDYQGTRAAVSYGNYNDVKLQASHYRKLSAKAGISIAGYFKQNDGWFTNRFNDEKNNSRSAGGRAKLDLQFHPKWKSELSLTYDHSFQNAYPYAQFDPQNGKTGEINYNEDGSYLRDLLSAGLSLQRKSEAVVFTSATGYQYLDDRMNIDQDFTSDSIFSLSQKQKQHIISQEFVLRSNNKNRAYQWVTGLFGFYKKNTIDAPMKIYADWLRPKMGMPPILSFDNLLIPGDFELDNTGAAIYHQSSYTFFKKLTFTAGLRLDYEKIGVDYFTEMGLANMKMTPPNPMAPVTPLGSYMYSATNNHAKETTQLLPKIALLYAFNSSNNIYASVAKGYKAGGYNYTTLSTFLQDSVTVLGIARTPSRELGEIPETAIYYRPETSWNYEVGMHLTPVPGKLMVDMAAFFIDIRNQQMQTTADNGSRMITNADKVESYGGEISVKVQTSKNFSYTIAYGCTHSSFKEYIDNADPDNVKDFKGNFVPFVPQNTLSAGFHYTLPLSKKLDNKLELAARYNMLGKIYWNEENTAAQDIYGLLNGEISYLQRAFRLTAWVKNALDTNYNSFYFESLSNSFVQRGMPVSLGISAKYEW